MHTPESAESVQIQTEYIRLDACMKLAGRAVTGGEAKGRIAAGQVSVNGAVCTERGRKLRPGDAVSIAGDAEFRVARAEDRQA